MDMGAWLKLCDQPQWMPMGLQPYMEASDSIVLESQLNQHTWYWVIARQDESRMPQVRTLFKKIQDALSVRARALSSQEAALVGASSCQHLLVFGEKALRFSCPDVSIDDGAWGRHVLCDKRVVLYLPDVYAMSEDVELKRTCWLHLKQTFLTQRRES